MKISAVIIAKNEENLIADAIESLKFCDEVLVIDNDSTDRTADLSKKLGAKVITAAMSDFSVLRELGQEHAQGDWILYLDADERIDRELMEEIKYRVKLSEVGVYKIPRKNFYLGKNEWPKIEYLERLFKKDALKGWHGKLHESPVIEGKVGKLEHPIVHFTHRDLTSMLDKTIKWSDIEALNRLEAKHPKMSWWRFPKVMAATFFNYYILQRGWKLGSVGMIESMFQSFSTFTTYAKLWELQNKKIS